MTLVPQPNDIPCKANKIAGKDIGLNWIITCKIGQNFTFFSRIYNYLNTVKEGRQYTLKYNKTGKRKAIILNQRKNIFFLEIPGAKKNFFCCLKILIIANNFRLKKQIFKNLLQRNKEIICKIYKPWTCIHDNELFNINYSINSNNL